ncbi:MAG: patatin family protein [Dehalococcoidales bacterium]|nr:patatin family protein [Dehalococcoidales bacterium]
MGMNVFGRRKRKVGLALGSGVARGLAHIGVLQVLAREGIPIDMVAGTSIGSIIGAFCALGKTCEEILEIAREFGSKRFNYLVDLNIPKTGLIKGKKIEELLKEFYGDAEFSDCVKPFKCAATDIDTGEEVVLDEGPLWKAVRSSISIPVIFAVTNHNDRYLVDGALVNPVPVRLLKEMGADVIIAVNVIPERNITDRTEPNIFDVIMRTIHIVEYSAVKASVEGANVVIEPDVEEFALTDFHRVDELVEKGALCAREAVPYIKKALKKSKQPVV